MENKKIIAMMLTLSMLAAAFAGCLGGDDEPDEPEDVMGCMDATANNYNADATSDDGSCTYDPTWTLTPAAGVSAAWVASDWDPIIPNLNAGDMCDAILSAMTKTDARDQVVDFTRGYYTSSQGVIGASGAAAISDVSELNAAGTTIALASGTTSDIYAQENLGAATIQAYTDWPSVILAINNGDADYALGDAPVLALEGALMTTFSDETFGLAIREDSDELEDALNVAITALVDGGQYDAIFGAWFEGTVVLTDDRTADTATAYPTPTEGSTLTGVLESGSLEFCIDPFYPPFENLDADGNEEGFDIDVGDAIAEELAAHYMGVANPDFVPPVVTTTKIGLLNPLTGPIAVYAPPFTVAAQMAIDDLNAAAASVGVDMTFELIEADSGCSGDVASGAAQSLVDAGVVGVAGAACSGASMAANAVLNAAGVVQVSYASTNPGLSDADAYPGFWRVVPSDAIQGPAMADMVNAAGASNPALIHMTNDYGSGLADAFEGAWGTDNLCTKIGYEDTQTDFAAEMTAIGNANCGSIVMVSYSTDGAAILETAAVLGISLPTFGADGIADAAFLDDFSVPAIANGVTATKPRAGSSAGDFVDDCSMDETCAGGIYTAETYDAVMMIGQAAMMENGANMASHLNMLGVDYNGASGAHTFLDNGDVAGAGYDICGFDALSSTDIYFTCMEWWSAIDGIQATPFAGMTVSIGFLNPMTGPIAVYAPGFGVAANVALGMMNIAGWNSGLQFEMVMVDSGCSGDVAAAGAQTLLDAGVVGVVGAACSGATMAANAVLGAAGIPMISYASTNPGLSNATAYPHFFRVVPSDAIQGPALADVVTADSGSDVALLYMTNDYGSGLADSFAAAWEGKGNTLCASIGYEDTTTDFTSQVQSVMDNSCGSVMLISYAADGAAIVEELAAQSFSGQIFGGDGIAEEGLCASMADPSLCDGIVATKPAAPTPNERSMAFAAICGSIPDCADGIYTAEAFDAMIIMGYSVFAQLSSPGATLSQMIGAVGQGFVGASGVHTFTADGDVGGSGYCVGTFSMVEGAPSYDCTRSWTLSGGVS
uniref:Hydrophobic amino acid ABC transporter amino acid-binding protein (LivK) n=1 Tax=uncultured marine group II/III euryarchaeote KM3_202_H06 TaxID=1457980 RepID=A0A075GUP5_9EURY|nr:hydrophobic amino acid ABC transporter amino acid-binding protein (livK) [uncultured marine group II/III euryarchaeote KM3_202_H06]